MNKLILLFTFLVTTIFYSNAQLNISQVGHVNYQSLHNTRLNDVWGYVDETGIEYALVGARGGVSVVSLENPASPQEVYWRPSNFSIWRDLKTYGDYAYITTEAEAGLLIIDLSPLPAGEITSFTYYQGDLGQTWQSAHNLYIDEDGFAYIFGSNRGNGGVIILDVATDPMNPIEIGVFDNWYVHDGFARDGLLYLAHIFDGFLSIVDISDRANPVLLGTANTPSNFAHNIWPSDDGQFVFTTDEISDAYITAFDVSDPGNIFEVDRIQSSPGLGIVPHNTHIYQNWAVTSYYTDGITIHDISRPHNMVEVGNFDTSPLQSVFTEGCWGAYPFLPSGLILATDMDEGLFILQPDYKLGSYLEGHVTDAQTTNDLQGVDVRIVGHNQNVLTDLSGIYATGIGSEGEFNVEFSKVAYYPQTLTVNLLEGQVENLDVQLEPIPPFNFTVNVEDAVTGNPIVGANISLSVPLIEHELMTNGLGEGNASLYYAEVYEVIVGKWGYRSHCEDLFIDETTGQITILLTEGYYDDFSFDFGWSTTSNAEAGEWVRDIPNPTDGFSNPGSDVSLDCGKKAYVTGNEGFNPNLDNVTNGTVVLISPVFNLTGMSDPHVNYWTYFYNEHGPFDPDDTLRIMLSNGFVTTQIDYEAAPESVMREWIPKSIRVLDYMAPTANMQLFVSISDFEMTVNITEAAFDYFSVTNSNVLDIEEELHHSVNLYPNPTNGVLNIEHSNTDEVSRIEVLDLQGKIVQTQNQKLNQIDLSSVDNGVYFIRIYSVLNQLNTYRIVKQ